MSNFSIVKAPLPPNGQESLKVNKSAGKINGYISFLRFKDKDTNQFIAYCPSLDISGYGETNEKALEMIVSSIKDYFISLMSLPSKQIETELSNMGWKHSKIRNKDYSRAYVDINGDLKNFNAVDDKVERLTLQAV